MINNPCANMFGYLKIELIHQSINILLVQESVVDVFLKEGEI